MYIGRSSIYYQDNKNILIANGYRLQDTDVFLKLDNKMNIDINLNIKVIENEKEYDDFMKVLSSAYNDSSENPEENVYEGAITKCYYDAIKNTINSKEHMHIIAYDNDIPVSVATLNYVNGIGSINSVGTAQGHWNKGYGKQLIAFIINKFEELGGGELILNTEYQSKNQKFYEKLGFKEMYVLEQYVK